jgi:transcriptional regulator with XRE-family HTH domain
MKEIQPALFPEIPCQKKEHLAEDDGCCISDMILELMDSRNVSFEEILKQTGIPHPTLNDWIKGKTTPLTGRNLLKLAQFFNVHIHYLCFGIGTDEPAFNNFEKSA